MFIRVCGNLEGKEFLIKKLFDFEESGLWPKSNTESAIEKWGNLDLEPAGYESCS